MKVHLGWSVEDDDEEDDGIDLRQQVLCHPLCQCAHCAPLQVGVALLLCELTVTKQQKAC